MTSPESAAEATHEDVVIISDDTAAVIEAPEPERGLLWHVTTDPNPFARQLVFTEDGEEFLWWQLDPLALNGLLAALTHVRDNQLAALTNTLGTGGLVPAADSPQDELPETTTRAVIADRTGSNFDNPPTDEPSTLSVAWWAQHKLLAFLLAATALLFVVGLINGQG